MLDKNDLQMLQEMILASEQRLFGKIEESEQRMKVMMESCFDPKFNLLYENQQIMMERLAPRSRVDDLEYEIHSLQQEIYSLQQEIYSLRFNI